jgi:hypothetical protein
MVEIWILQFEKEKEKEDLDYRRMKIQEKLFELVRFLGFQ